MELDIVQVPVSEMKSEVESMFSEVARNRSIDFTIQVSEKVSQKSMLTDKQRLEQILRNLLSNAFKFTASNGHVSLQIHKAPSDVIFRNTKLYDVSEIIAFSVTDDGIGIPANKLGVVFEAFQQADGSTKRKYGGTGLGLSISRELANVLGGEIHVESEEDTGSIFTLYLPMQFESANMTPTEQIGRAHV